MKNFIFLFILGSLSFSLPANADDATAILEDVHSGPERNFDELMAAVVEVRTHRGYGTGTLFIKDKKHYVLTAAHVIANLSDDEITVKNSKEEVSVKIRYQNSEMDIAVLEVSEMSSRSPIVLKFRNRMIEVGDRVGYCGFPNRLDLACFSGMVSLSREDVVNVHSYTWMGASGSLVVDKKGRVVGILSALEAASFMGLPELLQDIAWVSPLSKTILDEL